MERVDSDDHAETVPLDSKVDCALRLGHVAPDHLVRESAYALAVVQQRQVVLLVAADKPPCRVFIIEHFIAQAQRHVKGESALFDVKLFGQRGQDLGFEDIRIIGGICAHDIEYVLRRPVLRVPAQRDIPRQIDLHAPAAAVGGAVRSQRLIKGCLSACGKDDGAAHQKADGQCQQQGGGFPVVQDILDALLDLGFGEGAVEQRLAASRDGHGEQAHGVALFVFFRLAAMVILAKDGFVACHLQVGCQIAGQDPDQRIEPVDAEGEEHDGFQPVVLPADMHGLMTEDMAQERCVLKVDPRRQIDLWREQAAHQRGGDLIAGEHQNVSHIHLAQECVDRLVMFYQQCVLQALCISVFLGEQDACRDEDACSVNGQYHICAGKQIGHQVFIIDGIRGAAGLFLHDRLLYVCRCDPDLRQGGSAGFRFGLFGRDGIIDKNGLWDGICEGVAGGKFRHVQAQRAAQCERNQQAQQHDAPERRKHEFRKPVLEKSAQQQDSDDHDASIEDHQVKWHVHLKAYHSIFLSESENEI